MSRSSQSAFEASSQGSGIGVDMFVVSLSNVVFDGLLAIMLVT